MPRFADRVNRIILLSDGENTAGVVPPQEAAELAKSLGIKIYTIGVGSTGYAPFPARDLFGRQTQMRQMVRLDEASLRMLAETTGGRYFNAKDTDSLENVYADIDSLEKTVTEGKLYTEYRELYSVTTETTLESFLAQGLGPILESRLGGLWDAILIFVASPMLVLLVPFLLVGIWVLRRSRDFIPWYVYAVSLFLDGELLKEDEVNLIVHGHEPTLSDVIVAAAEEIARRHVAQVANAVSTTKGAMSPERAVRLLYDITRTARHAAWREVVVAARTDPALHGIDLSIQFYRRFVPLRGERLVQTAIRGSTGSDRSSRTYRPIPARGEVFLRRVCCRQK